MSWHIKKMEKKTKVMLEILNFADGKLDMIEIANKDIVNGMEKAISFNSNNLNNIIYLYENKLNKYNSLLNITNFNKN